MARIGLLAVTCLALLVASGDVVAAPGPARPEGPTKAAGSAKPAGSAKAPGTKPPGAKVPGAKPSGAKPAPPKASSSPSAAPVPIKPRAAQRKARPAKHASTTPQKKRPRVVFDEAWASTPAARAASLDKGQCLDELRRRNIAFTEVPAARGVLAPVRLPRDVGGVVYRTELPAAERAHAPWDVFDCRVVVALDEWSPKLLARGFSEVILFSAWRPPPKTWPAGEEARRHPGALAVDVKRLVRGPDPTTGAPRSDVVIERDWAPRIGAPICGTDAPPAQPSTTEGKEARAIACEIDDARLFTVILTPHYDRAHHNHLHLEITPGVTWRLTK